MRCWSWQSLRGLL